jgi:hypothetical protein
MSSMEAQLYLIDAIASTTFYAVMGLPPSVDLVEYDFGVDGLLVEDVDPANVIRLASLELLRGALSQYIVQFKNHSLASIMTGCTRLTLPDIRLR